ncbi:hypothetical protein AARAC_005079 [Aspergillus arachidicola]|uniref:Uncharacterized protein n=1 Tax=Aspergillus arachidicola TaxID=656916 RepID=A0A2G7ELE7_9EURO|nr:hypothetical protein AARAC_005079 [Aspergillus arachidicola]
MDFVASLLGQPDTVSALLQTTWLYVNILDEDKVIDRHVKKTADDYASRHGVLNKMSNTPMFSAVETHFKKGMALHTMIVLRPQSSTFPGVFT